MTEALKPADDVVEAVAMRAVGATSMMARPIKERLLGKCQQDAATKCWNWTAGSPMNTPLERARIAASHDLLFADRKGLALVRAAFELFEVDGLHTLAADVEHEVGAVLPEFATERRAAA